MPTWFATHIQTALKTPVFPDGEHTLTLGHVLYLVVLLGLLVASIGVLKRWILKNLLSKTRLDEDVRQTIANVISYLCIGIGSFVILDTAGIDINLLIALAGAMGLGLSMGLQSVANNLVSGLVILFERPIKVGDRVEVGSVAGNVTSISWRSTTILTNDNIAVIVPNSEFISARVTNRTYNNRDVRIKIPVSVSYAADPNVVKEVLVELASGHPGVLQQPAPDVLFAGFGESSLNFVLRVWTREYTDRPDNLISDLNNLLFSAFKARGIEIPYPQRDINLRGSFVAQEASNTSTQSMVPSLVIPMEASASSPR